MAVRKIPHRSKSTGGAPSSIPTSSASPCFKSNLRSWMGVGSKQCSWTSRRPKSAARERPFDARALLFHKVKWELRFEAAHASQKNCTAALVVFLGWIMKNHGMGQACQDLGYKKIKPAELHLTWRSLTTTLRVTETNTSTSGRPFKYGSRHWALANKGQNPSGWRLCASLEPNLTNHETSGRPSCPESARCWSVFLARLALCLWHCNRSGSKRPQLCSHESRTWPLNVALKQQVAIYNFKSDPKLQNAQDRCFVQVLNQLRQSRCNPGRNVIVKVECSLWLRLANDIGFWDLTRFCPDLMALSRSTLTPPWHSKTLAWTKRHLAPGLFSILQRFELAK